MTEPDGARTRQPRIGIDLGGTKISGILLAADGTVASQFRVDTPRDNYKGTIKAIVELVNGLSEKAGCQPSVGIGIPGSLSPLSGRVQNANSTWLNGQPFKQDIEDALSLPVRLANDANCFALSEAVDGSGAGAQSVFGVILGTGCGGGLVVDGQLIDGPRGIGGEWGHNPLPSPNTEELPGIRCWCGRNGCLETWVSGPGMAQDHERICGETLTAEEISHRANEGNRDAEKTLARHASRLARGLAGVINIFDPERVVLGGGLSAMPHLYGTLPELVTPHLFSDNALIDIRSPLHGPDSGVRGAAWLWGGPDSNDDEMK